MPSHMNRVILVSIFSSINCFYISLGFKHTDKWKKLKKKDCEFCFLVVVGWNMTIPRPDPMNAIEPVDLGNFQVDYVLDINKGRLGSKTQLSIY